MLSWALPASACPGGGRIPGCVPAPCAPVCAVGFALPPRSPLRGAAPEPPKLLRVPPCALQPLESSAHSPGAQVSVSASGARGNPRPSGSCSTSLGAPFRPGRSVQLLLLRDGALLSWRHSPRPQPGSSRGPSPLEAFCFFISFSPSSYLDRSVNSSHCSVPGVLSLNLRPNS